MTDETKSRYEVVIGLEVHAHLATRSKMFCSCPLKYGGEPNTATCPVCAGMPGVLPVINQEAVRYALKTAIALECTIPPVTHFDRKNYYYPDLPKNYQISQNYTPLGRDGWMEIEVEGETKQIGIDNVHLEEDAGKSVHSETAGGTSGIDLNRAGTPLLEIVSKPDMRSVEELEAFIQELRQVLRDLEVSQCKMEEGQLRFEVSISRRPHGQEELGVRVEVKNLNSVRSALATARYEIERQSALLDGGESVAMETRLWDEERSVTRRMRTKEEAQDYRYFPEPDLVPVEISEELKQKLLDELPKESPLQRRHSITETVTRTTAAPTTTTVTTTTAAPTTTTVPPTEVSTLAADRHLTAYWGELVKKHGAEPTQAFNWVMDEVRPELNQRGIGINEFPIPSGVIGELLDLVNRNVITHGIARQVQTLMLEWGRWAVQGDPQRIVEEQGLAQITDTAELERVVAEVIAENPKPVADFKAGKKQAVGALVGQVMRATKGKANPQLVRQLLEKHLAEAP